MKGNASHWQCRIKGPKAYDLIAVLLPYLSSEKQTQYKPLIDLYEQKDISPIHKPLPIIKHDNIEKILHAKLREYGTRLQGEWFKIDHQTVLSTLMATKKQYREG